MKKILLLFFAVMSIFSCTPQESPDTFTDSRDGRVYKTVTIGEQVWMAENLAYLPSVVGSGTGSEDVGHGTDPYYYVYGYDGIEVATAKATTNYQTYGVLYNWTAALTACPPGWHLPSDAEWKQLEIHLGMSQEEANKDGTRNTDEGGKLKETGTSHWNNPNGGATNSTGFTALPGGDRAYYGSFVFIGLYGYWWSSTEKDLSIAWIRALSYYGWGSGRFGCNGEEGISVRCVQD